jgi:uncharacterized protein (TIGR02265 family)
MKARTEKLRTHAAVKGTMVEAHLVWADSRLPDARARLEPLLGADCVGFVKTKLLATDWIPFRCLVAVDRAIAALAGGDASQVFRQLGHHSAALNLGGVYRNFVADEPHRFFQQMTLLHRRFQNFGSSAYVKTGDRSGSVRIDGYEEYSPVFCESGVGYCEGALEMMGVPGRPSVVEVSCQCAGDPACVFDLTW